ncbi:ATP-binding protein, partial [Streptomyces sp. NPDC050848]|uniref:ATP-binding protein n=1 Tax=Streptomyces sp. NPDC050848 TaxID=3155791 RepID=UPI0033D4F5F2
GDLLTELPHTSHRPDLTLTLHTPALSAPAAPGTGRYVTTTGTPVTVQGHPEQLQRLLRNLLDNATRHARTAVTVVLNQDPGHTTCTIHNDGPPIPAVERERIFDRFTRLDDARSRDTGGTGLGLAIARDIASRHHATLAALPDTHGATFRLTLPTETPPPARQAGIPASPFARPPASRQS